MRQFLAFILLIGPLIFIHELGHLIAAKLVDVKVDRFSIGFGPPLFRWRFGETEYCLAPIPLGGYVTLLGQNPYDEVPPEEQDRSLANKPLWARYLVLGAGPLANLLLPLLLFFFYFLGDSVQAPPVIGTVLDDSAAATAGLEPGDRIVSIDDEDVRSWREMQTEISANPDHELRIQFERDGKRLDRYVTPRKTMVPNAVGVGEPRGVLGVLGHFYAPQIGILDSESPAHAAGLRTGDVITSIQGEPVTTVESLMRILELSDDPRIRLTYLRATEVQGPVAKFAWFESKHADLLARKEGDFRRGILPATTFVRRVEPGSPASAAGLVPGDRLLEVDGQPLTRWESFDQVRLRKKEEPIELLVQSFGGEPRTVTVTQAIRTKRNVYKHEFRYIWFGAEPHRSTRTSEREPIRGRFTYAARNAWWKTVETTFYTWTALRQMVTFQRGLDELTSVVGIFSVADTAASQGRGEFLGIMALISINLGLVNLLPIPILDGGHILFFTIEAIRRRPMGQRAREVASATGLVLILLLLLVALRNDVVRFWLT